MAVLDEIKKLREQGKTEQEIKAELQARGLTLPQIEEGLAQSEIKTAVAGTPPAPPAATKQTPESAVPGAKTPLTQEIPAGESMQAMQPSPQIMPEPQAQAPAEQPPPVAPQTAEEVYPQAPPAYAPEAAPPVAESYPAQAPPLAVTSETISEIAESIVLEKLYPLRDRLEKAIEIKTKLDTRISSVEERLQRIEKIIDKLQSSILQRVGTYATNVDDLKKELIETQKSFKALSPEKPGKTHTAHKEHKTKKKK